MRRPEENKGASEIKKTAERIEDGQNPPGSMTNYDVRYSNSGTMIISKDVTPQSVSRIKGMLESPDIADLLPEVCNTNSKDLYFDLVRANLKPQRVVRGRVTCLLSVTLAISVTNPISYLPFCVFVVLHIGDCLVTEGGNDAYYFTSETLN